MFGSIIDRLFVGIVFGCIAAFGAAGLLQFAVGLAIIACKLLGVSHVN